MQELEKILEEIDETIERYGENPYIDEKVTDLCYGLNIAKDIIRKHMNDGWIPVKERLPEVGEYVLGTNRYDEVLIYHYGWNNPRTRKMFFHLCGSAADITAWRPLPDPYRPERSVRE